MAPVHEPLDPADLEEYEAGAVAALRIDPDAHFAVFLRTVGIERFRVAREGGRLVAGAGWIDSAHQLGGRMVPAALVTVVWAAPHVRGRGVATGIMRALLEELRAAGTPLASLYPANLALYRRVGFEVAAAKFTYTVPAAALPPSAPEGWAVEPLDVVASDRPGPLLDVYEASLPRLGAVATRRVPPLWHSKLHWNRSRKAVAVVARDPAGEARGSAIIATHHSEATVAVAELQALEADAARTLLAHLAGYRGIFETAKWPGAAADPFAALLRDEPDVVVAPAMFRLVDVAAALNARGYPPGVEGSFALDIGDDVLPANAGPLVLTLDGSGAGRAEPGGSGTIPVTVRALAALYTGHATPRELAVAGGLEAPAAELDGLTRAFAGPRPWLADDF